MPPIKTGTLSELFWWWIGILGNVLLVLSDLVPCHLCKMPTNQLIMQQFVSEQGSYRVISAGQRVESMSIPEHGLSSVNDFVEHKAW